MSERIYMGIDLGGTAVKTGLCNERGDLVFKTEYPTGAKEGRDQIIRNIVQYARKTVEESPYEWSQLEGIGIGVAGFLDIPKGFVKFAPNLNLENTPLRDLLEAEFNMPVALNNDANVAALGEAWSGAGAGLRNVVCFTLGTGVGGGIIIDGQIYEGSGSAGELGHIAVVPDLEAVQCGCGQYGCLETVSSATGIIRMGKDAVERGDTTSLAESVDQLTAKDVFDAAKAGDEVSQRIVKRAASYLGKAMATLAVILHPQRFIIGGGVSQAGDILFEPIQEVFTKFTPPGSLDGVDVVPALLGNDAGMIGAAGLNIRK